MADSSETHKRSNAPKLYIPEPPFRPGDSPTFEHIEVPVAHTPPMPDPMCDAEATEEHATKLIRVLRFNGDAEGPWKPEVSYDDLRKGLRDMMVVRALDKRMFTMQRQGKMSFYVKSTGEEAVSVAHSAALRFTDMTFPTYRQQGILIERGCPLFDIMCQLLSNKGDALQGKSLPVLYSFRDYGYFTVSGNLGTQLIQGVGWAMAAAYSGDDEVASVFTGEGATAEGDFHYALNFASTYRAPCIINVVNNQWAISSFQGIALGAGETFAAKGTGYGLATLRVDGNDFLAVYAATRWAAERARRGGGATVIEHYTYRMEGHSTSDDPTQYRPEDEPDVWPFGDPVRRLRDHLYTVGEWSEERDAELRRGIAADIKDAYKRAEKLGSLATRTGIDGATLFEQVYAELPPHLVEQRERFLNEREDAGMEGRE